MRLCKGCYDLAMKAGNMDTIRRLVDKGDFFCVYGKPECGKEIESTISSSDDAIKQIKQMLHIK